MKIKLLAISLLASLTLVACNEEKTVEDTSVSDEETSVTVNETQDIKKMVYDFSNRIVTDKSAVIMQDQMIVQANGKDTVYDLTNEDFFVSIAPYINQTHP
jgi:hypothetical protein